MTVNDIYPRLRRQHARLAQRRPTLPPLLNFVTRPEQNVFASTDDGSLLFGPGNSLLLPNPADQAPLPQLVLPDQITQAVELSTAAPSSSTYFTSLITDSQSQIPLNSASLSLSSANTESQSLFATFSSSPSLPSSTQQSSSPGPTPTPSQSQSPSQSIIALATNTPTTVETSQLATSSASSISSTTSQAGTAVSAFSTTTSVAVSAASSTQVAATDAGGLPRVAVITLGLIVAIFLMAFLAALGFWIYNQRKPRNHHVEIVSPVPSAYDDHSGGFFGCLKKRRGKNTDDMSELGFGLGRAGFIGAQNSCDDDHRVGLSLGPENVIQDNEQHKFAFDAYPGRDALFEPSRVPFALHGASESSYPIIRRPLARSNDCTAIHADGVRSITLSPSRYQHLNGMSITPLKIANLLPGDVSGDEGGSRDSGFGCSGRGFLALPPPVLKQGTLRTPRPVVDAPRFTRLGENESLTVPWVPLNSKPRPKTISEENSAETRLFEPLALSRASTLSLAFSRTISQHLQHKFSNSTDCKTGDGKTHPPQRTFHTIQEETLPRSTESDDPRERGRGTWAATLRNNFYNALSAVGSYGVPSKGGSLKGATPCQKSDSGGTFPNPYSESSRQSSMDYLPPKTEGYKGDVPSDIFTPPPARIAQRSKGSIIRGNLGIDPQKFVGLGIDALSRSSTLSTSWSDREKVFPGPRKVLDRDAPRAHLPGTAIGSKASVSSFDEQKATLKQVGRARVRGRNTRALSRRPRYSRMLMSQSSVWSSESYASTIIGANSKVRG